MTDRKILGLTSAIGIVISSMVGAGLYTTSGFALADLKSPALVLLAWGIAGVIALCGAIGYGALARQFQESGGEYLYLSKTVHPAVGFLAGIVSIVAGFTGAIAFAAITLEASLLDLSKSLDQLPAGSIASTVVVLAALQHMFRVRIGSQLQNAIVLSKLSLLLIFIAVAFTQFPDQWDSWNSRTSIQTSSVSLSTFATSLMWISFSYCGFNAAIYCAGEIKNTEQTVPRALLIGTLLVVGFYWGINSVFVYAAPYDQVAGQEQIATIVAGDIGGVWFAWLMGLVIVISLYTSVSVSMMIGPRVLARMAEDGNLPGWFNFQGETPRIAIFLQAIASILFIQVTTLRELLTYLSFTLSLCSAITVGSLLLGRHRNQIRLWQKIAASFFTLATLMISFLGASRNPRESAAGLMTILVGLLIYWLISRRRMSVNQD